MHQNSNRVTCVQSSPYDEIGPCSSNTLHLPESIIQYSLVISTIMREYIHIGIIGSYGITS